MRNTTAFMRNSGSKILFNLLSYKRMKDYKIVLLVVLILLLIFPETHSQTCKETLTSFSLSSRRNNTGHWLSELIMDFGRDESNDENKQTGPWNIAIDLGRETCGGKETLHIVAAITVPPGKPDSSYEFYPGIGYYKFHTDKKNWADARKACAVEGGHLVILNSEAEAQIAKHLFSQYPELGKFIHIGFHDRIAEGQYLTLFGEPLNTTGYTKWLNGQPDNYGEEDCGGLSRDGTLNDLKCTSVAAFICEHEL